MNKILKLVISGNKDDLELAKEFLTKDPKIEEHLLNILNYLGPRGTKNTDKMFKLSILGKDADFVLYTALDKIVGQKRRTKGIRSINRDQVKPAKESLKILMEENNN